GGRHPAGAPAKVTPDRPAPRHPRTAPQKAVKRRGACTGSWTAGFPPGSDVASRRIKMPGSAWVEAGAGVALGRVAGCGCAEEVVPIPAINGRPVISRADMAA